MEDRTPVSKSEVDAIKAEFPELPEDYFEYLLAVGCGVAASGRMIYSGPVDPAGIYGARFQGSRIVLLGDDMQGYCLGFDREACCLGEVSDFGEWQPWPPEKRFISCTEGDEEPEED